MSCRRDAARLGANNTGSHGRREAKRVAHGKNPLAHLQSIAVADWNHGQILCLDLQKRHIGCRVSAHNLGIERAVVIERNLKTLGIAYHMVVGHDIAILADDDSRTKAYLLLGFLTGLLLLRTRTSATRRAEKEVKQRIAERSLLLLAASISVISAR